METPDRIKIFIHPEELNCFLDKNTIHDLPFFLPVDDFNIIRDINAIDYGTIVPILYKQDYESLKCITDFLGNKINDVILLVMMHTHDSEYSDLDAHVQSIVDMWSSYTNKVLVCMTFARTNHHPNTIWYDFLWNRAKVYYTQYDASLIGKDTHRMWTYHATQGMFTLSEIKKQEYFPLAPFKPILAPNKTNSPINYDDHAYDFRIRCRKNFLQHLDDSFAYYSDWESKPRKLLESEESLLKRDNGMHFAGWFPIANNYYNATFVSAYIETLAETSQSTGITEKTFDPLIKGHFILPFGYCGIIKDIQEVYGFKLPNWIDYSYDKETSNELRFHKFLKEMHRLSKISIDDYFMLFKEDRHILEYNRRIFYTRPYDSLSNKIKESIVWKSLITKNNYE